MNEAELHPHAAEIGVTKSLYEAGLVVFAAPLSEFSIEVEEAGFGVVATPDFSQLLHRLGREEVIGIKVMAEEKRLSPKTIRKLLFGLEVSVGHGDPRQIAKLLSGSDNGNVTGRIVGLQF